MITPERIAEIRTLLSVMSDAYFEHIAPGCSYRSPDGGFPCGLSSGHEEAHCLLMPPKDGWGHVADARKAMIDLLTAIDAARRERDEAHLAGVKAGLDEAVTFCDSRNGYKVHRGTRPRTDAEREAGDLADEIRDIDPATVGPLKPQEQA